MAKKEWCPGVKAKACVHGTTPWTDCEICQKDSKGGWKFKDGEWRPSHVNLSQKYADDPFGKHQG
jgi:hypothetical protein